MERERKGLLCLELGKELRSMTCTCNRTSASVNVRYEKVMFLRSGSGDKGLESAGRVDEMRIWESMGVVFA